ncbi:hypothetical protein LEUCIP111803_01389 [Leucobacter soli]|uniref:Alkaline phosphatase family protein n=4 Tax=Leucobacter soli TaxID=2812850 RepID=A0A916JX71_9MICO|nr:hypothetical protein LEUCIP111803_01389 [Leucobacter soli]
MVIMLPTVTDNGARLAAILPTGIAALARGLGADPAERLSTALGRSEQLLDLPEALPSLTGFVMVVVDGLGTANLNAAKAHAPVLASLAAKRIETVLPSTTGAALTTLATGRLPGEHGLIGYRIRHPELGLRTTLKEWDGIDDVRSWQRAEPLWRLAEPMGARAVAIGRPAHAHGGLTEAILGGAEYHGAQTIAERFGVASRLLRAGDPLLAYVYIDELDRAAHHDGWQSAAWLQRLESLDAALGDFLQGLPGGVGVAVTADHGMIDVPPHRRLQLDAEDGLDGLFRGAGSPVAEIGGEPRMRSLYLEPGADAATVAADLETALGKLAWVGTRDEAIEGGWFGRVVDEVAPRLGEVLIAARGQTAFTLSSDSPSALAMVGQHGGLSAEERGVPLALAGELAGTGFVSAMTRIAATL